MRIEKIPIDKINPAKYNPRKDLQPDDPEYQKLLKSITEYSLVEPLVWNKKTGNLVGGHQRLKVLKDLGYVEVEVSIVDLNIHKEKALNIALNKIQGEWDFPKLKDLLQDLDTGEFDITLTGFDVPEIEDLMTQFHIPGEGLTDDDEILEKTENICKTGDLWELGNHKLLCGDATKKEDVERLMGGEKADMVFTDPPYGVDYVGKTADALKIENDKNTFAFRDAILLMPLKKGSAFYCCCPSANNFMDFEVAFRQRCFQSSIIVWVKNSLVLGHGDYHHKHELILYGWEKNGTHHFYGGRDQTTVWEIARPLRSDVHPIMKPVELCGRAINNSSRLDDIVLDNFGGSGSTLIACEKLGRRCYMMEISEMYCDVIIQRWQNYTGKQAIKEVR